MSALRPRLLDLFCGAGGCAKGYQRAGFYVVGVDIEPQPNYCGDEFWQADAIETLECGGIAHWTLDDFAAIHASPPCQHYANVTAWRGDQGDHPALIAPTRELLEQSGLPWVMENVRTAELKPCIVLCGSKADATKHYPTMTLSDIAALPVAEQADESAHLWCWALNGMMREAHEVVIAWGFRPITLVTWCKPQPGVGYYLRNNTESCIFATRGESMVPKDKPISTWFKWPRGAHSAKPDAFYDLVEQVSPGPYAELFSRRARFGWDYPIGDQALGGVAA